MNNKRNLFTTKTALGIYIAVIPTITSMAIRYAPNATQDIKDVSTMVSTVLVAVGGVGALAGRHSATDDVYTPDMLPGRNKDDINTQDSAP